MIQDLQQQVKKQVHSNGVSPASSVSGLSSQEDLHKQVETLRLERELHENEGFVLQKTIDELSKRLENQQQSLLAKDETIARMMEMFKNKNAVEQQGSDRKMLEKLKADVADLKGALEDKESTISSLQEVQKSHLLCSKLFVLFISVFLAFLIDFGKQKYLKNHYY